MIPQPQAVKDVENEILQHLDEICSLFKDPTISILIRCKTDPSGDGDIFMTSDDFTSVRLAIDQAEARGQSE